MAITASKPVRRSSVVTKNKTKKPKVTLRSPARRAKAREALAAKKQTHSAAPELPIDPTIDGICQRIQSKHRLITYVRKSRVAAGLQLLHNVATVRGYSSLDDEKSRKKGLAKAQAEIQAVFKRIDFRADFETQKSAFQDEFQQFIFSRLWNQQSDKDYEAAMLSEVEEYASQLPVAAWILDKKRCGGIGIRSLAAVVGEAGNLSRYSGPAKLWKRMGLAPITNAKGDTRMGSSFRKQGGLTAEEWTKAGYCPRRRSVMYVIGTCIIKQNGKGPFRKKYDEAKKAFKRKHKDCTKGHAANHGGLLATKLFLKELWCIWNNKACV